MPRQIKLTSTLSICSLNINRSNSTTQAAMQAVASRKKPAFNILLVQEPWWEKINNSYISVAFRGWQAVLPKLPITEGERPRVMAYYRLNAQVELALRNDLASDLDYMILDVQRK